MCFPAGAVVGNNPAAGGHVVTGRKRRPAYSGRSLIIPLEFSVKPFIAAVFAIAMGVLVSGCAGTGSAGTSSTSSSGSGVTVFGTIDAGVSGTTNRSDRR
jgi:hypothetical protein